MNVWLDDGRLLIYHTGYSSGRIRQKIERNLALLQMDIAEHASVIERLTPALQRVSAKERPYKEKICNLLGQCYRFLGDSEKSTAYYRQAADAADNTALKATEYSNYLFNLHYLFLSEEKIYHSHCGYNRIFSKICPFMQNCG